MTISEETLMAYADDELRGAEAAGVEAALRQDAELEHRVMRHRELRHRLRAAFEPQLHEHVPDRLVRAARGERNSAVDDLAAARTRRDARNSAAPAHASPRAAGLSQPWWAVAASLVLGMGLGFAMVHAPNRALLSDRNGELIARSALARSLEDDLSGTPMDARVRVGISFKSKSGDYCRAFDADRMSGFACKHGEQWRVAALDAHANAATAEYRTAGSTFSPAILQAIEAAKDGDALDRSSEQSLRSRHWNGAETRE